MNKLLVLGVFVVIFVAGLLVLFNVEIASFDELMRSLNSLSPRIFSFLLLPFVAAVVIFVLYLHKRREQQLLKNALKESRAKTRGPH